MNTESEEFDKLRKLLSLKRHEQPPPGYFDGFSRQVVTRLNEKRASRLSGLFSENAIWWQKLWRALETNPMFAGAFGVAICVLLISGLASFPSSGDASATGATVQVGLSDKPLLVSKAGSAQSTPSMNPMFSTNISGDMQSGQLGMSVQPVVFNTGN